MTRSSNQPLRVAFVGAGRMAQQHLQALRRVAVPAQVVAVCDAIPQAARALAAASGARVFSDCASMMEAVRPDIVHVVTSAGRHFDAAHAALTGGAHVYVEKPFVETTSEAEALLGVAARAGRLVCPGHQQLYDQAYQQVMDRAPSLVPAYLIDSHFTFRPPTLRLERAGDVPLAEQLIDILPHPLYTLLDAAQRLGTGAPQLQSVRARATDLAVTLSAGDVTARLFVSLSARPIASTLTVAGAGGALTADFVRSMAVGAGNPGTSPLEKILNPLLEGWQQQVRTVRSVARRLTRGGYPGLAELIGAFYTAVRDESASPVTPEHIRLVTATYERLAGQIRQAAAPPKAIAATTGGARPVALLTGARGFLGTAIARALTRRGFRVRGTARSHPPATPDVHEWVVSDLSHGLPDAALDGVAVVVHAAAETGGGFDEHQRNSIDATRQLIAAMTRCGVRRMVYVSSISVLEPPRAWRERQHERTALAHDARRLGPYTWGKTIAEQMVSEAGTIETRIIRPGALVDWAHPELPGLAGRRLFGTWHLGLGRPGLPIAVCDVERAGGVIAWCADQFDRAPARVNLYDDAVSTRADLLHSFRKHGWRGRIVWVPISFIALMFKTVRTALALVHGRLPTPLSPWDILRPRWYDPAVSREVLTAAAPAERSSRAAATPVSASV